MAPASQGTSLNIHYYYYMLSIPGTYENTIFRDDRGKYLLEFTHWALPILIICASMLRAEFHKGFVSFNKRVQDRSSFIPLFQYFCYCMLYNLVAQY